MLAGCGNSETIQMPENPIPMPEGGIEFSSYNDGNENGGNEKMVVPKKK